MDGINSSSSYSSDCCTLCGSPIPAARLKAIPDATECTHCKMVAGDEPLTRRYDEYFGPEAEDFVSTYFRRPNQYIRGAIDRLMQAGPNRGQLNQESHA